MDLIITSYLTGTSAKGNDWLMLKTSATVDEKSGRTELQRRCLLVISSEAERDVATTLRARIDAGKPVIVDSRYELKDE